MASPKDAALTTPPTRSTGRSMSAKLPKKVRTGRPSRRKAARASKSTATRKASAESAVTLSPMATTRGATSSAKGSREMPRSPSSCPPVESEASSAALRAPSRAAMSSPSRSGPNSHSTAYPAAHPRMLRVPKRCT
jgi:hypothetical protein